MKHQSSFPRPDRQAERIASVLNVREPAGHNDDRAKPRRASAKNELESAFEQFTRWRRSLKRVEIEAGELKCVEVEVLAGVAMLAVDDLIKAMMRNRGGRREASGRG
jgi:hypothetical protein